MADGSAKRSPTRDIRTICLPCTEEKYRSIVDDAQRFRSWLDETLAAHAELFPDGFADGFTMADKRISLTVTLFGGRSCSLP